MLTSEPTHHACAQVVHAQVHLQARLAPPRRNVTRGPSILGSGYAYGAAMRRRSTGLHVVPRQDLGRLFGAGKYGRVGLHFVPHHDLAAYIFRAGWKG